MRYFPKSSGAGTTLKVRFSKDGDENSVPRFAIGYWSIRGLGAPLRMLLSAARIDHDVFLYDIAEDGEKGWKSDYFVEKPELKEKYSPFMNLPFVVDREKNIVVCQTNACMAHLGRELGMWGSTAEDASKCEELLCEIYDLRCVMTDFAYGGKDATKESVNGVLKAALKHLKKIEMHLGMEAKKLGTNGSGCHLVASKPTAPDFHLFELMEQFDALSKSFEISDFLERLPQVQAFRTMFRGLSENAFYLESFMHKDLPFNNCMANFASAPGPTIYKRGQDTPWMGKGDELLSKK